MKSIPGTGKIDAITVRAYIDDIKRFSHFNRLSVFAGLVPWVNCFDPKKHYGNITKRGPIELRTNIVQMVFGMIRCKDENNNVFMNQYKHLKKRKGTGKAIIAIARKMTKLIYTLLVNNEEYDPQKLSQQYVISKALSMRKESLEYAA